MFREVRPLRLLWVVHSLHHMRVLRLLKMRLAVVEAALVSSECQAAETQVSIE